MITNYKEHIVEALLKAGLLRIEILYQEEMAKQDQDIIKNEGPLAISKKPAALHFCQSKYIYQYL
jgi:hypothetical protein